MSKKADKPARKLPDWIIVSAGDPKLQKAVEEKLAAEMKDRGLGDMLEPEKKDEQSLS